MSKLERPVPKTEGIVRQKTVFDRTCFPRSTIYRKIAEGTFPSQVKISVHGPRWHETAINRWIADPAHYREEEPAELAGSNLLSRFASWSMMPPA